MEEKMQEREKQLLLDEKYGGERTPAFFADVKRLENGEPLDYVIGWKEFLGCRIDLSKRPFIPRPETEFWVRQAIEDMKSDRKKIRCLDLFAGSGCIGVAVLKYMSEVQVDFAEKNEKFLEQIKINLELNRISLERYHIIQSDIFSGIRDQYDYIFVNPPYLAEYRKDAVQKSVIAWEPCEALFGGEDGLFFIKKILDETSRFLKKEGRLYMEFDSYEKEAITRYASQKGYHASFFKDQYDEWRWCVFERADKI